MEQDWRKVEKNLAWQLTKVINKKRSDRRTKEKDRIVHFASLMNLCHLKHSELELQYQKYKGSAVLGGLIVKDDSGSYAVFTEQGSSQDIMDVIARLPGCAEQAAEVIVSLQQG